MGVDQREDGQTGEHAAPEAASHRQERARFSELSPVVRGALILGVIVLAVVVGGNVLVNCVGLSKNDTGVFGGGPVSPELTAPPPSATPSSAPIITTLPPLPSPTATRSVPAGSDLTPPGLLLSQPADAKVGQPIVIAGTYGGHDGIQLQIQRLEDGVWADFPVTAEVSMGRFNATISSSTSGPNQIRVYDQGPNRASNVVTVTVS